MIGLIRNLLAVCHGCNVVVTVTKLSIMILLALKVTTRENFAALSFKEYIKGILFWLLPFFIRHILLSVLVGLVVYREALDLSLSWQRAFIATSIIIASNNFMMLVSRYPLFGGYIHMLSKVRNTSLARIYLSVSRGSLLKMLSLSLSFMIIYH